jgi:hypothetical protein
MEKPGGEQIIYGKGKMCPQVPTKGTYNGGVLNNLCGGRAFAVEHIKNCCRRSNLVKTIGSNESRGVSHGSATLSEGVSC